MIARGITREDAERAASRISQKLESQEWYPSDRSKIAAFVDCEEDNEEAKMIIARMNKSWQHSQLGWSLIVE